MTVYATTPCRDCVGRTVRASIGGPMMCLYCQGTGTVLVEVIGQDADDLTQARNDRDDMRDVVGTWEPA